MGLKGFGGVGGGRVTGFGGVMGFKGEGMEGRVVET